MTADDLRAQYPYRATILRGHPSLPEGKTFPYARKVGVFVIVRGHWPAYFHGRQYFSSAQVVRIDDAP